MGWPFSATVPTRVLPRTTAMSAHLKQYCDALSMRYIATFPALQRGTIATSSFGVNCNLQSGVVFVKAHYRNFQIWRDISYVFLARGNNATPSFGDFHSLTVILQPPVLVLASYGAYDS